ncbi:TPA: Dot/Icm T4SS effector Ceg18 [Legionella pneumophila subsp. pneumophila]|nr:Dot/Icm T4SS effector Ceg18 [Legionella pneumophila]MDW9138813.1 Dot/Icm T4SS effector Ceg18 [Legionella pneumophila]HAT8591806.1 Dot/Icm T4SS effector Ceg18 [Legionella pneumophila]HAT8681892.1 Dot/Icm T4SS effector Ceg18 [Legionella pneumophila subsp. pneumophila ATCC 43283]HAT9693986.1 Dot/Icm T4SS effector Ceg18 [Legionella pneumophila subsp. pneumophila]HAT9812879.1 Dot/Icm T4SS effector Ceg18 [Legionella pneumophila subsp. pneumophila]
MHLTREVNIMSILSAVSRVINNFSTEIKNRVVEVGSNLKKSTEEFIGEVVIKAAVNRLKQGMLNALSSSNDTTKDNGNDLSTNSPDIEDVSAPTLSSKKKAEANTTLVGSTGIMQKLLGNIGVNSEQSIEVLSKHFNGAVERFTQDVSKAANEAVCEKIKSIQPEDVIKGINSLIGNSLKVDSESGDTTLSFKLESAVQILGVILATMGMLMFVSQTKSPEQKTLEIEHLPTEEIQPPSLAIH